MRDRGEWLILLAHVFILASACRDEGQAPLAVPDTGLLTGSLIECNKYYVSTTATESGTGTITNPWRIETAFANQGSFHGCDTVFFRAGTYPGKRRITASGNSGAQLVFRQYANERVILQDNYMVPQSGNDSSDLLMVNGSYVTVMGFELTNSHTAREGHYRSGGISNGSDSGGDLTPAN